MQSDSALHQLPQQVKVYELQVQGSGGLEFWQKPDIVGIGCPAPEPTRHLPQTAVVAPSSMTPQVCEHTVHSSGSCAAACELLVLVTGNDAAGSVHTACSVPDMWSLLSLLSCD